MQLAVDGREGGRGRREEEREEERGREGGRRRGLQCNSTVIYKHNYGFPPDPSHPPPCDTPARGCESVLPATSTDALDPNEIQCRTDEGGASPIGFPPLSLSKTLAWV